MRTYYLYKFHFMGRSTSGRWAECLAVVWDSAAFRYAVFRPGIEALRDETARNSLLEEAKAGRFLLSDAFPYRADELFLPKPLIRTEQGLRQMQDPGQRKLFKKLTYLPASLWDAYLDLWREGRPFDAAACLQQLENLSFLDERACAAVRGKEETDPYLVRGLQFNKDCGLYCIL
ncbi:MAG: type III-A CRISPR-associated RAMP protein Csm4, partial [Anaeromassilibacillus sp.]